MDEFRVDLRHIAENRAEGISGFMRIRNEAEYLPQAVESHLPFLDELVIVYNRCSDGSEDIIKEYERKYLKVKSFKYLPEVYPQGSEMYLRLPPDSLSSLVNYYNFALAATTMKTVVKIDGDDIAIIPKMRFITENIRKGLLEDDRFWVFAGINLWREKEKIFINGRDPFPGLDHGFFNVTPDTFFKKGEQCEYLGGELKIVPVGYMYYHAKGIKKDRGVGNYDLEDNPDSYYAGISYKHLRPEELLEFSELIKRFPQSEELKFLPAPESYIKLS